MITINQQYKFNPSVNILRDVNHHLEYITTPNANIIFGEIIRSFQSGGKRSFNIIGSYGTGKSSFLWALKRTLFKSHHYFTNSEIDTDTLIKFEDISIIGEYNSFQSVFAESLGLNPDASKKEILAELEKVSKNKYKDGQGLLIIIDEFGKFLEYAAQHNADKEMYFIQQLAEFVNNEDKNIILITTLHQGIDGYSLHLDKMRRKEWEKVKGRLKELPFNEPVEQLLLLASERMKLKDKEVPKDAWKLIDVMRKAKAFPMKGFDDEDKAKELYPFDILSASVLTLALQKYGQNERSLFSFIDGDEYLSIQNYDNQENAYYHIALVYDYLIYHFHDTLISRYNPHYNQWYAMQSAIESIEGINQDITYIDTAQKIIKIIGLLGIFAPKHALLDEDFLIEYAFHTFKLDKTLCKAILQDLKQEVVVYRKHLKRFIFKNGTDLDIDLALQEAEDDIPSTDNLVEKLKQSFSFPYTLAKAYYYEYGIPRFFESILSEQAIQEVPENEIDGFINLVFSKDSDTQEVQNISENCSEAILYGCYHNTTTIKKNLHEIEKIKKVIEINQDDKIALNELNDILIHYQSLLNKDVIGNLYNNQVTWYFRGEKHSINSQKEFNQLLSKICREVYDKAPKISFEMIQKTKVSGAMRTALKKLLIQLTDNFDKPDLYFKNTKFPPEKSIYLALLQTTGIHQNHQGTAYLQNPTNDNVKDLWQICEAFLNNTKTAKRNLGELESLLLKRPLKLKKGFVEFFLPIFLFVKRQEYALFSEHGFVPHIDKDNLELIIKNPERYEVKAFDIEGVKLDVFNSYREFLNQNQEETASKEGFIEIIKPFIVFYKQLPEYSKNTTRLSKEAKAIRNAIVGAKDLEKTFFEDFPQALGYSFFDLQENKEQLIDYIPSLQKAVKEIRTSFDELLNRFENTLKVRIGAEEKDFEEYKALLQTRFSKVKQHLLLAQQRVFHQRIQSALDDKKSWLLSIGQACLGKSLESISDKEEAILHEKLITMIEELDNLSEISEINTADEEEEVLKVQLTSLTKGLQKQFIRLPKKQLKEINQLEDTVNKLLTDKQMDKSSKIALFARLLEKELEK